MKQFNVLMVSMSGYVLSKHRAHWFSTVEILENYCAFVRHKIDLVSQDAETGSQR